MNYLPVRCAFPPWGKTGKGGVPFDCTHFPAHRPYLPFAAGVKSVKGARSCAFILTLDGFCPRRYSESKGGEQNAHMVAVQFRFC